MSNIKQFTPKQKVEEVKSVIKLTYTSGDVELIDADSFGQSADIDQFIAVYNEDPYEFICFINKECIQKVEIVLHNPKENEDLFIEDYLSEDRGEGELV